MADTTFVDGSTLTSADWFNDLNDAFHTALGGVVGAGTLTKVQFPATQSASADANALDDYEEGTFTPSLGGNTTYNAASGSYTKIGRHVFFRLLLDINTLGTGSGTTISGLPFTVGTALASHSIGYFASIATNVVSLMAYSNSAGTTISFSCLTAAAGSVTNLPTVFQNGTQMYITGHYHV